MLNSTEVKKLRTGAQAGYLFAAVCAAALVYFIIAFPVAEAKGLADLKFITVIVSPVIMLLSAGAAAFCNLTYGRKLDRLVCEYIRAVMIENAALMHPERDSLTFVFEFNEDCVTLRTNAYKEKIDFDFSAVGKLTLTIKSFLSARLVSVLEATFCRLYDRGASFESVSYTLKNGRKTQKPVFIIADGTPDKRAYKNYLNSK